MPRQSAENSSQREQKAPEIERLYAAFSSYHISSPSFATPLREIEWDEVDDWLRETRYYCGGERDWKYLLPRWLELAIDQYSWNFRGMAEHFKCEGWPCWDEDEVEAVRAVWGAGICTLIERNDDDALEQWVKELNELGEPLSLYSEVLEPKDWKQACDLSSNINSNTNNWQKPSPLDQLLISDERFARSLESWFERFPDAEGADDVAQAVDLLDRMREFQASSSA